LSGHHDYRSGDVGGNGAPPTEIGPVGFGVAGFLRCATAGRDEATGSTGTKFRLDGGAGGGDAADALCNASILATKADKSSVSFNRTVLSSAWVSVID
jgi:hypothetical protein